MESLAVEPRQETHCDLFVPSDRLCTLVAKSYRRPPNSLVRALLWNTGRSVKSIPEQDFREVVTHEVEGLCEALACRERSLGNPLVRLSQSGRFNAEMCCELETGLELRQETTRVVLEQLHSELLEYIQCGPHSERERYWGRLSSDCGAIELKVTLDLQQVSPPELATAEQLSVRTIDELNLSVRARVCLEKLSISTLDDLIRHSEDELLSPRNFGESTLKEIQSKLKEIQNKLNNIGAALKKD